MPPGSGLVAAPAVAEQEMGAEDPLPVYPGGPIKNRWDRLCLTVATPEHFKDHGFANYLLLYQAVDHIASIIFPLSRVQAKFCDLAGRLVTKGVAGIIL